MSNLVTRRDLLRKSLFSVAAVGAAGVLAACKKDEPKALVCTDTAGLTPQEIEARNTLGYVDKAPDATKKCTGCALFNPPAAASCGGCKALKGPIHPDGWCKSFAPKPA